MEIIKETPLARSPFIQIVSEGDNAIIWHSLFGFPKIVSKKTLAFLNIFENPRSIVSINDEYEIDNDAETAIRELMSGYFLISQSLDERKLLRERMGLMESSFSEGGMVNYLEIVMSETCNFRCVYCIHFNNLERSERIYAPDKLMTFAIASEAIKQYLGILRKYGKKLADINFGGGEPLLSWKVIKGILEYCVREYGHEFAFKFSLNTNASLITPEVASTLKKFQVEIATSLDGLCEGNNAVRMTSSGRGTFDAIMSGFDNLAKQGYPLEGISMTINERNFPFLNKRILDWAFQRKMSEVRIDIDVIGMVNIPIEEIAEKLMMLKKYANGLGIEIAGFWSRPVENLNTSSLNDHVVFCGVAGGRSICITPSGEIYGCGHSKFKLGNLNNFTALFEWGSRYHQMIKKRLTGKAKMCRGCMIEGQCGGGCKITQEFARAAKTAKIERMCDFYRQMTRKLLLKQLREMDSEVELEEIQTERR